MQKIKAILISHASVSVYMKGQKTLKQMILDDWYSLTAKQIKKYYPEIEVECFTPERAYKTPQEFIEEGIKYRQFPTTFSPIYGLDFSISMLKEMKKEVKKAKEENYKLIFHLHEYHCLHGLIIATMFKGQKIIGQHHGGSWPLKHIKDSRKKRMFFPFFFLGQLWEKFALKNISCFYALSKEEMDYLKKTAPDSLIKFQTMGIEEYYFKDMKKSTARKKLNWQKNKKILLYLGRIIPVKGIGLAIDAMKELEEFELKVIGWGEEEHFKEYAKSKKINNVEFLGPIFYEKKLPYLSAADIFILPSSKEGAPVSVMEAMARDMPCIVTDIGGTSLMIKNNENGIIIREKSVSDIVNAARKIIKWKKRNIKKYARRYFWKKIINDTVRDYKEI
ncbi:MAG: glycosyltransferase family 4 protein [Candidatus Nanoarchaeia archaeon]